MEALFLPLIAKRKKKQKKIGTSQQNGRLYGDWEAENTSETRPQAKRETRGGADPHGAAEFGCKGGSSRARHHLPAPAELVQERTVEAAEATVHCDRHSSSKTRQKPLVTLGQCYSVCSKDQFFTKMADPQTTANHMWDGLLEAVVAVW